MNNARISQTAAALDGCLILSLTEIILQHIEADFVFDTLMKYKDSLCFRIGDTYTNPADPEEIDESEACWINLNPSTKEIADEWGIDNWIPESKYKFSIGFGNYWEVYDTMIDVTLNDLLPSRGLNIPNVPDYEKAILDICRPQYIARMRELIRQI